jgi:hypothetical protein
MPLTKAQRRKINQNNAKASTGPRDTSRTRFNALKHGLRANVLCLPDEDPTVIQQRSDAWNDYYQPQDPAEQHLVNECVRATLLSDRVDRFHTAEVAKQVRHAGPDWIHQQIDRRQQLVAGLVDDPEAAIIGLKRFGFGLLYLIDCWERLERSLIDQGYWDELERDEAMRLLGYRPEPETLKQNPEAWVMRLFNLCCRPRASDDAFAWLFHPSRLPDFYRTRYKPDFVPDAETARARLRETVADELAALRAKEEQMSAEIEDDDYAETEARAAILRDEKTARLFLRYHAESRTSFQRAYGTLVKSIAARAEEPVPVAAPTASPNEANPAQEPPLTPDGAVICDAVDEPVSEPVASPIGSEPRIGDGLGDPAASVASDEGQSAPEAASPNEANPGIVASGVSEGCVQRTVFDFGQDPGAFHAPYEREKCDNPRKPASNFGPTPFDPETQDILEVAHEIYARQAAAKPGEEIVPMWIVGPPAGKKKKQKTG